MEIPNSTYLNKSADVNCVEVCLASRKQNVSLLNKNVQCDIRNIRKGPWRETLILLHEKGQPQRGSGTCLGLECPEGLPAMGRGRLKWRPFFPSSPSALRVLCMEPPWALGCTWLTVGDTVLSCSTLLLWPGLLFVHWIPSVAEWSRLARQVLRQRVEPF